MCLLDCKVGDTLFVSAIELDANVKRRFEILGLTCDTRIEVLNKKRAGSMIIKVRGTRFAVGARFAAGIIVRAGDRVGA